MPPRGIGDPRARRIQRLREEGRADLQPVGEALAPGQDEAAIDAEGWARPSGAGRGWSGARAPNPPRDAWTPALDCRCGAPSASASRFRISAQTKRDSARKLSRPDARSRGVSWGAAAWSGERTSGGARECVRARARRALVGGL